MPIIFNLADMIAVAVASGLIVGVLQRIALNNRLAGITAAVKPVRERRANRLRHRAPEPDEQGTDTVIDEDTAEVPILTGRQRWVNGLDPRVAMSAERQIWHGEAGRVNVLADEILIGAGVREMFADVLAEATPLYNATTEALTEATGAWPVIDSDAAMFAHAGEILTRTEWPDLDDDPIARQQPVSPRVHAMRLAVSRALRTPRPGDDRDDATLPGDPKPTAQLRPDKPAKPLRKYKRLAGAR